jgi:hypothetical protein
MPRGMDRSGHAREVPHHRGQLSQGYEGLRAGEQSSPTVSSSIWVFFPSSHSPISPSLRFAGWQVFSDEFEQDGRSFEDGADPRWTAIDKNDCESAGTMI